MAELDPLENLNFLWDDVWLLQETEKDEQTD